MVQMTLVPAAASPAHNGQLDGAAAAAAAAPTDALPCSVPAPPGSRLAFSWGTGTELRVAEVLSPGTGAGGQHPHAGICLWACMDGEQRAVAYQLMPLYRALKQQLAALGPARLHEAKEARRQYSAAVLDVLLNPPRKAECVLPEGADAAGAGRDELPATAYEAALWQLLELFFLRTDAEDGYLAEAFASWMAQHGSLFGLSARRDALREESARLRGLPRVDSVASYWPAIHRLVLLGRVEAALELLTAHPAYQHLGDPSMAVKVKALDAVYCLLRVVPRLSRAGDATSQQLGVAGIATDDPVQFASERADWQRRVDRLYEQRAELLSELQAIDRLAAKGLQELMQLLCAGSARPTYADMGARVMAATAHNWVELLAGSLLWRYPTLPALELRSLVVKVAASSGADPRESDAAFLAFFEQLLLAACSQEVQPVINLLTSASYAGLQFVVHVFEVLAALPSAARVISRALPHAGCDQAEAFTLNYAEALMGFETTWALAAEYLAWCPVYGGDALEGLLARLVFSQHNQRDVLRAVALAQRHGLTAAGRGVARRWAAALAEGGQLAGALQWALLAHDAPLTAQLVAPLMARVQQELLAQANGGQAGALDLPALQDLEPLLLSLLRPPSGDAADAAAANGDSGGAFSFEFLRRHLSQQQQQQQQQHPQQPQQPDAAAAWKQHARQQQPYPELSFLAAMLQLQTALQELRRCAQGQQQAVGGNGAASGDLSEQQAAALGSAYQGLRQPVRQLLLEGLAPAAVRVPLLVCVAPLFDSKHMPFVRSEVQGCMQVLADATTGMPAAASAILDGTSGISVGLQLQCSVDDEALKTARVALCRGLARAHVRCAAAS